MIPENELRLALEEYQQAVLAALPQPDQCEHIFSPQFEVKMRRVLRRAKHPVAYQTLRRIACAILILLVLSASVLAISPSARAAVVKWIKDHVAALTRYSYVEQPGATEPVEHKCYELSWLPEGYTLLLKDPSDDQETIIYVDESGNVLDFSYIYGNNDASSSVLFEGVGELFQVTVGEYVADFYLPKRENERSVLVWQDSKNGVLFYISVVGDQSLLLKLAESIRETGEILS